ncbi:MAG: hypothetical protein ACLPXB_00755 [Thiobacillaceae bacterium]
MLFRIAPWASGITSRGVPDARDRAPTMRPIALATAQLGLSLIVATAGLTANASSQAREGDSAMLACHSLMTDNECRSYRVELARAGTPDARDAIKARYDQLQREREQTCACNEKPWIRIRQASSSRSLPF